MLRLAADENFNGRILRGLRRRFLTLDVIRIQDTDLGGLEDPEVLAWAAREGRVLLTHDTATMRGFAADRVRRGKSMPGIVTISSEAAIGAALEDLALFLQASEPGEWEGQIVHLPF